MNLHFPEKQLLIKGMIEWCSQVTEEINQEVDDSIVGEELNTELNKKELSIKEECVRIVCKMMMLTEKYAE